jgi:hypothetical protein
VNGLFSRSPTPFEEPDYSSANFPRLVKRNEVPTQGQAREGPIRRRAFSKKIVKEIHSCRADSKSSAGVFPIQEMGLNALNMAVHGNPATVETARVSRIDRCRLSFLLTVHRCLPQSERRYLMPTLEQLNPFSFDNWSENDGVNGCSTGDEANVGNDNLIFSPNPNDPNSVTMVGATIFEVTTPRNMALQGCNDCLGDGAVGVFGMSYGATRGIGVAGSCSAGCGVCGVGTNSQVTEFPTATGTFAVGDNVGVYGQSLPNKGQALDGVTPDPGTGVFGVGDTVGVRGQSRSGTGVLGVADMVGVHGKSANGESYGVQGENTHNGIGVFGSSVANENDPNHPDWSQWQVLNNGVVGFGGDPTVTNDPPNGYGTGTWGMSYWGIGALGQSRKGYGVQGISGPDGHVSPAPWPADLTQVGVYGSCANSTDKGIPIGVQANSTAAGASGIPVGVKASSSAAGATAVSVGVFAKSVSTGRGGDSVGVAGLALASGSRKGSLSIGIYGECDGTEGAGVYGTNNGGRGIAIVGDGSKGMAGLFNGDVVVNGNFYVSGTKSAAVKHSDGSHRVLYSIESPESWFEDFGEGKLTKGRAQVKIQRDFVSLTKTNRYYVFLTPHGDSNGLYVSEQTASGFTVREQCSGMSSVAFSYRIVAKRKDVEGKRLAKLHVPALSKVPKIPARLRASGTKSRSRRYRQTG